MDVAVNDPTSHACTGFPPDVPATMSSRRHRCIYSSQACKDPVHSLPRRAPGRSANESYFRVPELDAMPLHSKSWFHEPNRTREIGNDLPMACQSRGRNIRFDAGFGKGLLHPRLLVPACSRSQMENRTDLIHSGQQEGQSQRILMPRLLWANGSCYARDEKGVEARKICSLALSSRHDQQKLVKRGNTVRSRQQHAMVDRMGKKDFETNSSVESCRDDAHCHEPPRRTMTTPMSPDLFERLYLQPRTAFKGELRQTFGNPTPIGLMGLAVALTPLSAELMGWRGSGGDGAATISVSIWFGGVLLLFAGVGEFILGNTFSSVVFMGYAGHFLTFATTFMPFFNAISFYTSGVPESPDSQIQTAEFSAGFAAIGFGCGAGAFWQAANHNMLLSTQLTFSSVVFMGYAGHFLTFATTFMPFFNAISFYTSGVPESPDSQIQTAEFSAGFGSYIPSPSCPPDS
nr:protein alcs [Quercus suber]